MFVAVATLTTRTKLKLVVNTHVLLRFQPQKSLEAIPARKRRPVIESQTSEWIISF